MKIFSQVNTAIQGWHSVSNNQNEKLTNPTSNLVTVKNSPLELKTLTPSQSTSSTSFLAKFMGTKLPDASPLPAVNGKFSQLQSLYGSQLSEHYKALDGYLTIPDNVVLMDVHIRERKTAPTETEVTLGWSQASPAYSPLDSEKTLGGALVSEPFLNDLSRANYIIELPSVDGNQIKLDNNMSDGEKISHLYGIFGEENTKIISEIAHQGHMAEFAGIGLGLCKDQYIISQGDAVPEFIISKQEDGSCRITSLLTYDLKNIETGKTAHGLSLEMKRTNVLPPDPDNKTNLRSGAGEEKDGISFKIKYVKPDVSLSLS